MSDIKRPYILGLGGTTRAGSTSEKALRVSLDAAQQRGAVFAMICGADLEFPMYAPHLKDRSEKAKTFLAQLRRCDGLIIASPSYHGSISGLIKNALDYIEDLRESDRVYLDELPVGVIGCGAGWQGATQAVTHLRTMVHALRGWPTPMGAVLNSSAPLFNEKGECIEPGAEMQLKLVGEQVVQFANMKIQQSLEVSV